MTARIIITGVITLLCAGCGGTVRAQDGPPVYDGEVIVKFSAGQDIDTRIGEALQSLDGPEADTHHPEIRDHVSRLSEEAGVPLAMVRITGGGELILAIPRRLLLESLAERVRSRADVSAVEIRHDPSETALSHNDELIVEFGGEADALERLRESSEAECKEVARSIIGTLLEEPAYSFDGRRLNDNRLSISVDVQKVALDLAARLNERPDIEYAQPNFAVRVYDDSRC